MQVIFFPKNSFVRLENIGLSVEKMDEKKPGNTGLF